MRKGAITAVAALAAIASAVLPWMVEPVNPAAAQTPPAQTPPTQTPQAGGPGVPVTAATVDVADVPVFLNGIGTVQAFNMVTIKSRVDGQIVRVDFTEGQEVKAGAPLIQIDPRPFQAVLEQMQLGKM